MSNGFPIFLLPFVTLGLPMLYVPFDVMGMAGDRSRFATSVKLHPNPGQDAPYPLAGAFDRS